MTQIANINAVQAGKVAALLYLIVAFIICVPLFLITLVAGSLFGEDNPMRSLSSVFLLIIPFFYAVIGFVGVAIVAAIYNVVAKATGGIELTFVSPKVEPTAPSSSPI